MHTFNFTGSYSKVSNATIHIHATSMRDFDTTTYAEKTDMQSLIRVQPK